MDLRVSLSGYAKLFVLYFIGFIAVFSVIFWETHTHDWFLYVILLTASSIAVMFFGYMREVDQADIRNNFIWNARRYQYTIFLFIFSVFLLFIFFVSSVVEYVHLDIVTGLENMDWMERGCGIVLTTLVFCLGFTSWRISSIHWAALLRHDCFGEEQRASRGEVALTDGIWMVPADKSPYNAESLTQIAHTTLNL